MIQSSIRLDDDEEVWLKGQLMGNTISGAPIQDVVINNITMMPNPQMSIPISDQISDRLLQEFNNMQVQPSVFPVEQNFQDQADTQVEVPINSPEKKSEVSAQNEEEEEDVLKLEISNRHNDEESSCSLQINSMHQSNFIGPISKLDAQIIIEEISVSNLSGEQVIIQTKYYQLQKQSFLRLKPGKWLNDEVVNAQVSLVNLISPQTFAFYSFFFTMLQDMRRTEQYSFKNLHRIVKKKNVNLRNLANILIPININRQHWLLMNVNMRTSTFEIIDSMSTPEEQALDYISLVRQFLQDYFHAENESLKQPKGVIENVSQWSTKIVQGCTKQINDSDCGVHTCHNMRLIASTSNEISQLSYKMNSEISAEMRLRMQMEIAQFEPGF